MIALTFISIAVLTSQACANINSNSRSPFRGLLGRQDNPDFDPSDIPPQCTSDCGSLNTIVNCADTSCVCQDSVISGLASCLDCVVSIAPDPNTESQAQTGLNELVSSCQQEGISVESVSLSIATLATAVTPTLAGASTALVTASPAPASAPSSSVMQVPTGSSSPAETSKFANTLNPSTSPTSSSLPLSKSAAHAGVIVSTAMLVGTIGVVVFALQF
ncbi:hypothetical protein AcW1_003198 [Taiwanofungus camphoratus]|nr:hypothetical protein AcV5_001616 [Antrodia cinnamomea]KAI0922357.1 hypothetical protein AcV7_005910 [Antrodia cinnamomea]KAI0942615.1 hypothetical protein AcW1_003198 [Antrodia cinnamomea]